MKRGFVDLVVAGPDMSGTSTQIKDIITFFQKRNLKVRDLRGTEIDALFHTEKFQRELNRSGWGDYSDFRSFLEEVKECAPTTLSSPRDFLFYANELLGGGGTNQDLRVASMVKTEVTSYIDPDSADVWIMEEPTKRGAGQVNRVIEQNRSSFGYGLNPIAAALSHQAYRSDEALRFRIPLRKQGKIILRSRSEESACYQIWNKLVLPNGIKRRDYLKLPGHEIAFRYAPTHIFIVCAPKNWTTEDYIKMKEQRSQWRRSDDHEKNAEYQVLVNRRYATNWLENLYQTGCKMHGGTPPTITRFNLYDFQEDIKQKMIRELEKII
jgi:thymidylate kinase